MCFLLDWDKRIEYSIGSASVALFPNIRLETCDGPVSSVRTSVELQSNHIGKGCNGESYSDTSLKKLCGKSGFMIYCHNVKVKIPNDIEK